MKVPTMVETPITQPPRSQTAPNRTRILTTLIILLAAIGTVTATWTILDARTSGPTRVGEPVDTHFGSMMVTRLSKTFVPDTQGPPTAAQHVGANGRDQLQVWVNLENTDDRTGVSFGPEQFSLVTEKGEPRRQQAAGSTLGEGRLEPGGSIDGQVWFDSLTGRSGRAWLIYTPPGGQTLRVSLGKVDLTPAHDRRNTPSTGTHSHEDDEEH
jgi:hypothetical protein